MHEIGVARDLSKKIFDAIKEKNKVKKISIALGKASGIEKNLLIHSLKDHIFKNTILENVKIEIIDEEPQLTCKKCNKIYNIPVNNCTCGSKVFDITAGKDVYILKID